MRKHLAIMHRPVIEAILSGRKTIESRFSKHRIPPFGQVSVGDLIYMKQPGEEIVGQFRVKKVYSYEGLTKGDIKQIQEQFGQNIDSGIESDDHKYWYSKQDSNFCTLIFISNAERFITSPIRVKKSDQRGWMILN